MDLNRKLFLDFKDGPKVPIFLNHYLNSWAMANGIKAGILLLYSMNSKPKSYYLMKWLVTSLSPFRLDHPISYGTSLADKRPYLQQQYQQQKKRFDGKMSKYKPKELSTKATKSWSTLTYFEDPNSSG